MRKMIRTIRDGDLSVAIFKEDTDGKFLAKISKTYQTSDGKWHETTYYKPEELLPMARLIARVSKLMKADK